MGSAMVTNSSCSFYGTVTIDNHITFTVFNCTYGQAVDFTGTIYSDDHLEGTWNHGIQRAHKPTSKEKHFLATWFYSHRGTWKGAQNPLETLTLSERSWESLAGVSAWSNGVYTFTLRSGASTT